MSSEELEEIIRRLVRPLDRSVHSKAVKDLIRAEKAHFHKTKPRKPKDIDRVPNPLPTQYPVKGDPFQIVDRLNKTGLRSTASSDGDTYQDPISSLTGFLRQYDQHPPKHRPSLPPPQPTLPVLFPCIHI